MGTEMEQVSKSLCMRRSKGFPIYQKDDNGEYNEGDIVEVFFAVYKKRQPVLPAGEERNIRVHYSRVKTRQVRCDSAWRLCKVDKKSRYPNGQVLYIISPLDRTFKSFKMVLPEYDLLIRHANKSLVCLKDCCHHRTICNDAYCKHEEKSCYDKSEHLYPANIINGNAQLYTVTLQTAEGWFIKRDVTRKRIISR